MEENKKDMNEKTFLTMFTEQLDKSDHEYNLEKDGDEMVVTVFSYINGDDECLFIFDKDGNLSSVSSVWRDKYKDLQDEVEPMREKAKVGEAVHLLAQLFIKNQ